MLSSPFDRMHRRVLRRFARYRVVYLRGETEYPITAVYDAEAEVPVLGDNGIEISTTDPQLSIHQNALPFSPSRGDRVRVTGQDLEKLYEVYDAKPDSEFGITLKLHEVDDDEP